MRDLYLPVGVMRLWPTVELELQPFTSLALQPVDTRTLVAPTSVGYVPIYDSLEALIAEHGDVPYTVMRRS